MVEHLAKLTAIHPSATCRAAIKMLCFIFGRIAHARADVAAWELNDRTVLFGHWESLRSPVFPTRTTLSARQRFPITPAASFLRKPSWPSGALRPLSDQQPAALV